MKLKKTLKRIVVYGSLLACLNYYGLPLVSSIAAKSIKNEIQNKKIQQVCQTDQHLEDVLSSIDRLNAEPIQLLKAAHAITSKKLDLTSAFLPGRSEREKAYKGGADCTYFSIFTYSNFLYLADAIGRPSLKDKVRLMMGVGYYEGKTYEGHVWLQVNIDGKWHDYEASKDLIKKNEKIDFKELDKKLPDEKVLDGVTTIPISCIENNGILEDKTDATFSIKTGADLKSCIVGPYFKNGILEMLGL